MTEKIKKINNPLTIIAIFAALAEVNATIAIGLIDNSLHHIFIWFIIGFPTLLVLCFFLTLNFNTKVMYSPSDYKEDKSFTELIKSSYGQKELSSSLSGMLEQNREEILGTFESKTKELINNSSNANSKEEIIEAINKSLSDTIETVNRNTLKLNLDLKEKMLNFFEFPSNYLLIYAIVASGANTINEIKEYSKKYYLPPDWDDNQVIMNHINTGILIGTVEEFKINPELKEQLTKWAEINKQYLTLMSKKYKQMEMSKDNDFSLKEKLDMLRDYIPKLEF